MYPIQCPAGYPMALAGGKGTTILGFQGTVEATATASQVTIVDDERITGKFGNLLSSTEATTIPTQIMEKKGFCIFNNGTLEFWLPEPIKTRFGISVYVTNIIPSTLKVFRR